MRVCDEYLVAVYRPDWSNAASRAVCQGRPVVHEPKPIIELTRGRRRTEEPPSRPETSQQASIIGTHGTSGMDGGLSFLGMLCTTALVNAGGIDGLVAIYSKYSV